MLWWIALMLALITSSVWAQNRNSPYNDTFGAIQLQALVGGPGGVAPPSVVSPQFLLQAPGAGFILQTNATAKICLANTC